MNFAINDKNGPYRFYSSLKAAIPNTTTGWLKISEVYSLTV